MKDQRYRIHPTENVILGLRDLPKCLGTQYQVQNDNHFRKYQKVIKNDNDELEVENYLKKNNQSFNNQNLNHQIVLPAKKIG